MRLVDYNRVPKKITLIEVHHIKDGCFLLATAHLTFEVDERKRFSRVVCYLIVVVELDENFEVEFFVGFELDTAGKDGAMFTICYLDHVRRPDEIVHCLSVFNWVVYDFVLFTLTITKLYVTKKKMNGTELHCWVRVYSF